MSKTVLQQVQNIQKLQATSTACITAAVLMDNNMLTDMSQSELTSFCRLAEHVEALMFENDEPRFTLYDYLDAVVNNNLGDTWGKTAKYIDTRMVKSDAGNHEDAFKRLVYLAEAKRETYEGT